ncbi:MAG: tetratricopeptide repeat protein, partial [Gemmatimonadetes bacterium]|nr:tetratricopeptide repeat protein [Gemmatimonadota bacterium]
LMYLVQSWLGPEAEPLATFRWLSGVAGVLYLLIAVGVAWRLGGDAAGRGIWLALLLTGGFLQLFAGYAEFYAPLFPLLLLYLAAAWTARRGDLRTLLGAAAVLGVLVALHLATVSVAPSLLVVAWLGAAAGSGTARRAGRALLAAGVTAAVAGGLFVLLGFDVLEYIRTPEEAHRLPLLGELTFRHTYLLLDPRHFLDAAWQVLLVAPAAALVLAAAGAERIGGGRAVRGTGDTAGRAFLAAAVLFPVAFTFIANPEVGPFRDWDAFAFAGLPLSFAAAIVLGAAAKGRKAGGDTGAARGPQTRGDRALLFGGVALLHSVTWIGVNHQPAAAETRFKTLLESCPVSQHGRAYGWESLGTHLAPSRPDDACDAFENAIRHAPDNPRYWNNAGKLHAEAGRFSRAEECFREAVRLGPNGSNSWLGLGMLLTQRGAYDEAAASLLRALELNPGHAAGWYTLGTAEAGRNRLDAAAAAFTNAVKADPNLAVAWFRLGQMSLARGDAEAANDALGRFLRLQPVGPEADQAREWLATLR